MYTDFKDLSAEQQVETALDAAGIFYNKTETWIDSEKLYEVLYFLIWRDCNGRTKENKVKLTFATFIMR